MALPAEIVSRRRLGEIFSAAARMLAAQRAVAGLTFSLGYRGMQQVEGTDLRVAGGIQAFLGLAGSRHGDNGEKQGGDQEGKRKNSIRHCTRPALRRYGETPAV